MNYSKFEMTAEQKRAMMLHINERLYERGEISKLLYEIAKSKIILQK